MLSHCTARTTVGEPYAPNPNAKRFSMDMEGKNHRDRDTSAVQITVSGPKVPLVVVSAVRSPTEQVTAGVGLRLHEIALKMSSDQKIRYDYSGFSRKAFTLEY